MIHANLLEFGLVIYVKYWTWWKSTQTFKNKYGKDAMKMVVKGEVIKIDYQSNSAIVCFSSLGSTSTLPFSYFGKSFVTSIEPQSKYILTLLSVVENEGEEVVRRLEKGFRAGDVFGSHGVKIIEKPCSLPALSSHRKRSSKV